MAIINTVHRDKDNKKTPTRVFSTIQEKHVAKVLDATRAKNSGATLFDKSDVSVQGLFNIECKTKTTSSESISIKKDWIEKNKKEALFMGRPYSAIAFNFGPNEEMHYIIDEDLFIELVNYLKGE